MLALIYNGPRTDPCGTPYLINLMLETKLERETGNIKNMHGLTSLNDFYEEQFIKGFLKVYKYSICKFVKIWSIANISNYIDCDWLNTVYENQIVLNE